MNCRNLHHYQVNIAKDYINYLNNIRPQGYILLTKSCLSPADINSLEEYLNGTWDYKNFEYTVILKKENPMTYKYYHEQLKGSSPKNAPTYEETSISQVDKDSKKSKWKCSICGYIHEADELPDDFKCPLCGVGKEYFELVKD